MNCQYPTRKGCVAQLKHGAEGSLTLMFTTVRKSIVMLATIPMITFRKLRMDMAISQAPRRFATLSESSPGSRD